MVNLNQNDDCPKCKKGRLQTYGNRLKCDVCGIIVNKDKDEQRKQRSKRENKGSVH